MTRTYTLFWTITGEPPGGLRVTAEIPTGWTETLDGMGCPTFRVPGGDGALVSITAIHAAGASDADRLAWALHQQFDDLAQVTQTPRDDGRIWAVQRPGGRLHARMFVPAPHGSIVMAVVMTFAPSPPGLLAIVDPVFDTVRVG